MISINTDALRHVWSEKRFGCITFCTLCDELIPSQHEAGVACSICNFNVHRRCLQKTDDVCPEKLLDVDMTLLATLEWKPPPRCLERLYPSLLDLLDFPRALHNFRVFRYTKPTSCTACNKMLSGARSQGMRCINCNFNIHVHCYKGLKPYCAKLRHRLNGQDAGLHVQSINASKSVPAIAIVSIDDSMTREQHSSVQRSPTNTQVEERPPPRPRRAKSTSSISVIPTVKSTDDLDHTAKKANTFNLSPLSTRRPISVGSLESGKLSTFYSGNSSLENLTIGTGFRDDVKFRVEDMDKTDAEIFLLGIDGRSGDFLVRSSSSVPGSLTLSFVHENRVCHTRVHGTPQLSERQPVYLMPEHKCISVEKLLEFHHSYPIHLKSRSSGSDIEVLLARQLPESRNCN